MLETESPHRLDDAVVKQFLLNGAGPCYVPAFERAFLRWTVVEASKERPFLEGLVFARFAGATWAIPQNTWRSPEIASLFGDNRQPDQGLAAIPGDAPPAGTRFVHYKGGRYRVVAVGCHAKTGEPWIAYFSEHKRTTWARTLGNWSESVALPTGEVVPRFERITYEVPADPTPLPEVPPIRWGKTRAIYRPERDPGVARTWFYRTLKSGNLVLLLRESLLPNEQAIVVQPWYGTGDRPEYDVPRSLLEILPDDAPDPLDDRDTIEVESEARPIPPTVPWLPAAGSTWATAEGKPVTVRGTASVPGVGLMVLHDKLSARDERRGVTHGATPIADWHASVQIGPRAVRRFVPVAGANFP